MDNIDKYVNRAITKYFDALSKAGYIKESDMIKLMILQYIQELLSERFFDFMDLDSYNIIIDAIYRLSCDSCLIDVPYLPSYDDIFREIKSEFIPRITQDSILRITQDTDIRVKV